MKTAEEANPRLQRLGQRIAELRAAAGMSQEVLAARIARMSGRPFGRVALAQYERGENEPPTTRLIDVAKALGVPVSTITDDRPELTTEEAALLSHFRGSPPALQGAALAVLGGAFREDDVEETTHGKKAE